MNEPNDYLLKPRARYPMASQRSRVQ